MLAILVLAILRKKNSFDFLLKSLMLATANLWVFIKWHIGLNLDQFLPAIYRGRSEDKSPTFPGITEDNKFLRFLTQIADSSISKFMGLY
jgi:hypothetical protein